MVSSVVGLSIGGNNENPGERFGVLKGGSLFLSLGLVLCLFRLLFLGALDPASQELLGGASHAHGLVDAVFPLLVGDDAGLLALLDHLDWHDGSGQLGGQFQLGFLTVALLGFAELLREEDELGSVLLEALDVGLK